MVLEKALSQAVLLAQALAGIDLDAARAALGASGGSDSADTAGDDVDAESADAPIGCSDFVRRQQTDDALYGMIGGMADQLEAAQKTVGEQAAAIADNCVP